MCFLKKKKNYKKGWTEAASRHTTAGSDDPRNIFKVQEDLTPTDFIRVQDRVVFLLSVRRQAIYLHISRNFFFSCL